MIVSQRLAVVIAEPRAANQGGQAGGHAGRWPGRWPGGQVAMLCLRLGCRQALKGDRGCLALATEEQTGSKPCAG